MACSSRAPRGKQAVFGVLSRVIVTVRWRVSSSSPSSTATPTARSAGAERRSLPESRAASGGRLSRDAIEHRLVKHTGTAAARCSSLSTKTVTAHTLRHTAAMRLLQSGIDTSVIALWLGHEQAETTQIYLHADLALKESALARTKPPEARPGRYRPPDKLLAFLEGL